MGTAGPYVREFNRACLLKRWARHSQNRPKQVLRKDPREHELERSNNTQEMGTAGPYVRELKRKDLKTPPVFNNFITVNT
jgi:hypothetical protein